MLNVTEPQEETEQVTEMDLDPMLLRYPICMSPQLVLPTRTPHRPRRRSSSRNP